MQIQLIFTKASLHQHCIIFFLDFMFLRRCFSTALFLGRALAIICKHKRAGEKNLETGNENIDIRKPRKTGKGKKKTLTNITLFFQNQDCNFYHYYHQKME